VKLAGAGTRRLCFNTVSAHVHPPAGRTGAVTWSAPAERERQRRFLKPAQTNLLRVPCVHAKRCRAPLATAVQASRAWSYQIKVN
jgi:hypothetical protein